MIAAGMQLLLKEGPDSAQLKCRVAETGDGFLLIDYPIDPVTGKTAFLSNGTVFDASFRINEEAVYSFRTEVAGRVKNTIPMIRITFPGEEKLTKIQRRQFVRVEASLDVAVLLDGVKRTFITTDISAGGCAIRLKNPPVFTGSERVSLVLVLVFGDGKRVYLQLDAEVLRVWERTDGRIASLEFIGLSDRDRKHIMRYCFEQQRQKRKNPSVI